MWLMWRFSGSVGVTEPSGGQGRQEILLCAARAPGHSALRPPTGRNSLGIHMTAFQSISSCSPDLWKVLFRHVVLSGGTGSCSGLRSRMQKELSALVSPTINVQVRPPVRPQGLPESLHGYSWKPARCQAHAGCLGNSERKCRVQWGGHGDKASQHTTGVTVTRGSMPQRKGGSVGSPRGGACEEILDGGEREPCGYLGNSIQAEGIAPAAAQRLASWRKRWAGLVVWRVGEG